MSIIEQIKAEIERRITDNTFGAKLELIDILAWLDTLEEPVKDFPTTDKEMADFLATHKPVQVPAKYKTADWIFKEQSEKPVPKDIEEAAEKHSTNYDSTIRCVLESSNQKTIWKREHKETFIAGANWQKEQLMKETVEGEAYPDDCEIWVNLVGYGYKFNEGDKVRIIIVKED